MRVPFENDTDRVIRRLAAADLQKHPVKTTLVAMVIVLATALLTLVFAVLWNDALSRANEAPFHALYQAAGDEAVAELTKDADFSAVGVEKNFGSAETASGRCALVYMDEAALSLRGQTLHQGRLPENADEVAVSASFLQAQGLDVGDTLAFDYVDGLTNDAAQAVFSICGVVENARQEEAGQFYVIASDAFRQGYAATHEGVASPYSSETAATVDVLAQLDEAAGAAAPEAQKNLLREKGAAAGIAAADVVLNEGYIDGASMDGEVLLVAAAFGLFLLFVSGFVVYSIFYISLCEALPIYAQLISLGMTKKQLRRFFRMEGQWLARRFIPLGSLLALSLVLAFYGTRWLVQDVVVLFGAAIFINAAIYLALKKPAALLAAQSPVDALRGTAKDGAHRSLRKITPQQLAKNNLRTNRRKNRLAVFSLSISGMLMIGLVLLLGSIDITGMVRQTYPMDEDFQLGIKMDNFYDRFPSLITNNPLSRDLQAQVAALDGVEKVVADECLVGKLVQSKVPLAAEDDGTVILNSMPPELFANVGEVTSGRLSPLAADEIVLNRYRSDASDTPYNDLAPGDRLTFQFNVAGETVKKTFTLAGSAYFPSTGLFYGRPEAISAISPYNNASHLAIFCEAGKEEAVHDELTALISGKGALKLVSRSDETAMVTRFIDVSMKGVYGLAAFVLFFGILNMVNMLTTSVIVRKREFALLRTLGMTRRQMRQMLVREGLAVSLRATVLAAVGGAALGALFCVLANEVMSLKFIVFHWQAVPFVLFAVLLIGLQLCTTALLCRHLERDTLLDRLRAL